MRHLSLRGRMVTTAVAAAGVALVVLLLLALVEANGRVLTRQALLEGVWGYSYAEGTRTVDVHVRRLREKLPGLADRLITVKSLGYRIAREGGE